MNESLICKGKIEYFVRDGKYYAIEDGVRHEVTPGSQLYLTALLAAVSHKDYPKFKKAYGSGNDLVYGFINDYLSSFNDTADIIDGVLVDCDGEKVTIINGTKVSPRDRDIVKSAADGYADKQIADQLNTSVLTVNTQFKQMREKYQATSKYHLVSLFAKAGLV
jgi:DNA-binding CsgD family transcriptional regulator